MSDKHPSEAPAVPCSRSYDSGKYHRQPCGKAHGHGGKCGPRPNDAPTGETCGIRSGYAVCYLTRGHGGSHISPRQEWDRADDASPRAPDYGAMTDIECCASGYHRRKGEERCACGYKLGRARHEQCSDKVIPTRQKDIEKIAEALGLETGGDVGYILGEIDELREAAKKWHEHEDACGNDLDYAKSVVVDWSSMTAEQVRKAVETRPTVLREWEPFGFTTGWSRHETHPIATDGAMRHVSVQPSSEPSVWLVMGLDPLGASRTAESKEEAFRIADEGALAKGWKLLGDVHRSDSAKST